MSKRRPWGSVTERRGQWFAVYTPHKGSKRRVWEKATPNTRTRALDILAQRQHELAADTWDDPARTVTFDDLAREWYASMKGVWRPQTAKLQATRLEKHILPALGDLPARRVDGPALQTFTSSLDLAPRTVRVIVSSVRQILRWGHRHNRLRSLPDLQVSFPKLVRRKVDPMTPAEIRAVLDCALDYRPLILWSVMTGMRQGETMAAKWEHLNEAEGTYYVCQSVDREGNFAPTKTGEEGEVWVPASVLRALDAQRQQIAGWNLARAGWTDHGLIFPSRVTGGPMQHQTLIRALRVACEEAGVRRRRWHDLRHTCASLLIDQGESIVTVSRQLRHSTPAVTLSTYSHLMPERGAEALAKLDAAVGA